MIHVDTEKYAGMACKTAAVGSMSVSQRKTMQLNAFFKKNTCQTLVFLYYIVFGGWGGVGFHVCIRMRRATYLG